MYGGIISAVDVVFVIHLKNNKNMWTGRVGALVRFYVEKIRIIMKNLIDHLDWTSRSIRACFKVNYVSSLRLEVTSCGSKETKYREHDDRNLASQANAVKGMIYMGTCSHISSPV